MERNQGKRTKGSARPKAGPDPAAAQPDNVDDHAAGRPPREELMPQQLRGIHALMTHPTTASAAEEIGVHPRTLSRWLEADPRFRAAFFAQMNELQLGLWRDMLSVRGAAWTRFTELLNSDDPRIALRAATWLLGQLLSVPPMVARLNADDGPGAAVPPRLLTFLQEAEADGEEGAT